jgi:hypothetical protein
MALGEKGFLGSKIEVDVASMHWMSREVSVSISAGVVSRMGV